ncbi:MAG: hypothetical protein ACHP7O_08505 [Burkholderiales bacterium]
MISRSLTLDLDNVVPGMTLSDDVLDNHGGVLLACGTVMTEAALSSLRRRGIDKLVVVDETLPPSELAAERAAERERLQQRLECLFRKCRHQGASELLWQSVTQYRLGEPI